MAFFKVGVHYMWSEEQKLAHFYQYNASLFYQNKIDTNEPMLVIFL